MSTRLFIKKFSETEIELSNGDLLVAPKDCLFDYYTVKDIIEYDINHTNTV